ncbi:uncharacterized protein CDAR_209841 [Caerostris darwini]|uniref:Gustatory receptor n=1 Tax=Caerostris darwini TaxID=1538125 RepID=A0AAV4NDT3_9ARAC|nr:uncharacterized protein CDAR_209841 [Caerostris darwini]
MLYCLVCIRSGELIEQLTQKVTHLSIENFVLSKRIEIMKQKSRIYDILDSIQEIFSFPSFMMVVANLLNCFSVLNCYLDRNSWASGGISIFIECSLYCVDSLVCLVSLLWIAGDVPVEDRKFKKAFQKKLNLRSHDLGNFEKCECEKLLLLKKDFVFTGWDILSYRRSSIFAVFGALMTYSVLVSEE